MCLCVCIYVCVRKGSGRGDINNNNDMVIPSQPRRYVVKQTDRNFVGQVPFREFQKIGSQLKCFNISEDRKWDKLLNVTYMYLSVSFTYLYLNW